MPVVDRMGPGHRLLAPDRPGYGHSGLGAMGMEENADWAADLLRSSGAVPATVVGHSWSGGVALLMAYRHPDLVRALVLVGAVGTLDSVNALDRALVLPVIGDVLAVAGLVGIGTVLPRARRVVGRTAAPSSPAAGTGTVEGAPVPGVGARLARAKDYLATSLPDEGMPGGLSASWGRDRRTFLTEQRALLDELPTVDRILGDIVVPTTVLAGAWDLVVPPSAARSLHAAIPGAQLVVLPGVGHFVARDAPDAVVAAIAGTGRTGGR